MTDGSKQPVWRDGDSSLREHGALELYVGPSWPTPVLRDDGLLVRVRATTVTTADWRARSATMPRGVSTLGRLVFGLRRPRNPILGTDLAGDVIAVGSRVSQYRVRDGIIAMTGMRLGAHAQFAVVPDARVFFNPCPSGRLPTSNARGTVDG